MEILTTPAPAPRPRASRLTQEIKDLQPGQSFITDRATARCAIAHYRYVEKPAVQKTLSDGRVQIWLLPE